VYKRLNSTGTLIQRTNHGGSSRNIMYYIGLDVHKKTISYCVKDASGQVHQEGKIGATRRELDSWIKTLPQPRTMAMESKDFHRLDLRSPAAATARRQGGRARMRLASAILKPRNEFMQKPNLRRALSVKELRSLRTRRYITAMRLNSAMPTRSFSWLKCTKRVGALSKMCKKRSFGLPESVRRQNVAIKKRK
jgi:hypothetical protein